MAGLGHGCGFFLVFTCICFFSGSESDGVESRNRRTTYTDREWEPNDVPNPLYSVWESGRGGKPSWISDPEQWLSPEDGDRLDKEISEFRTSGGGEICHCKDENDCQSSKNVPIVGENEHGNGTDTASVHTIYGGWRAGVAILNKIDIPTYYSMDDDETEDDYVRIFVRKVRRRWRLGSCNEDLFVLVVLDQRFYRAVIGNTLAKKLKPQCVDEIINENSHYFRSGDIAGGIWSIISACTDLINGHKECNKLSQRALYGIVAGVILFCLIVYYVVRWQLRKRSSWVQNKPCLAFFFRVLPPRPPPREAEAPPSDNPQPPDVEMELLKKDVNQFQPADRDPAKPYNFTF